METLQSENQAVPLKICLLQGTLILSTLFFFGGISTHLHWLSFMIYFFAGWLAWTFVEYGIHRFVMHELIIPGQKDTLFNHHEHHKSPEHLKVNVYQRALSFLLFIIITYYSWEGSGIYKVLAGFVFGFSIFNILHFILHQPIGKILLPKIQRAHILHHNTRPGHAFSFSTIFWDWLFNTLPPKKDRITERMVQRYYSKKLTK